MIGVLERSYIIGQWISKKLGLRRRRKLPVRVISIGNLSAGGTGKTPAAVALALELASKVDYRPAVLTRGYKGKLAGPVIIKSDMSAIDAGDEPLLMLKQFQASGANIPVMKNKDRYWGGLYALATLEPRPNILILDDGYQHWGLARDLDILLLSATEPFYADKCLPIGRLRETPKAIGRAGLILVTRCREVPDCMLEEIRKWNQTARVFPAWYEAGGVVNAQTGEEFPAEWLQGRDVFAFCGIGEPSSFKKTLAEAGANVAGFARFSDHHKFTARDLKRLSRKIKRKSGKTQNGLWIVTTEKDIMRLGRGGASAIENLCVLKVALKTGEGFYKEIEDAILR